jgi:apolipoprotein N-acyltransferase
MKTVLLKISDYINKNPYVSAFFAGSLAKLYFSGHILGCSFVFISFYILLRFTETTKKKCKAFLIGYCFGFSYFLSSLFWVSKGFDCVGLGNYGYIAVFILAGYLAIFPAFSCFFSKYFDLSRGIFIYSFGALWSLSEYVRGFLFTGFPWNLVGCAFIDVPFFNQSCSVFGAYGFSFLCLLQCILLPYRQTLKYSIGIVFASFLYGLINNMQTDFLVAPKEKVIIVQPSISQQEKMNFSKFWQNLDKHIALSDFDKASEGKRIIVWGEAAIPCFLNDCKNVLMDIASKIKNENDILITGAHRKANEKVYNSVFVINSNAEILAYYDKKHLLPFGEFIPSFFDFLHLNKIAGDGENFSEGVEDRVINLQSFEKFEALICYEIAFPGEIIEKDRPGWLLNLTNDAWFGSSDGPKQHLGQVKMRAIEEGLPIIRCANNGVSCVIDAKGNVLSKLDTNEIGRIETDIPSAKAKKTLYSRVGNSLFLAISVLSLFLIRLFIVLSKRRSQ